jgi:hypothetical protein
MSETKFHTHTEIIVLYILIFKFLTADEKTEGSEPNDSKQALPESAYDTAFHKDPFCTKETRVDTATDSLFLPLRLLDV